MADRLVSVVPTYHPPLQILDLLDGICGHGPVVVSDDASPCTFDSLLRKAALHDQVDVVRHKHNKGIARGLNDGLSYALRLGASWLLTVDQDTRLIGDYMQQFLLFLAHAESASTPVGVIGAGHVLDGKARIRYPLVKINGLATTPEVIQTGSLWNVAALHHIGGFDEKLGMDAVDAAACVRLRAAGYVVAVAESLAVTHRIGSSRSLRLLGRDIMITGHSPQRRSTMLRNRLSLLPEEFEQSPRHAFRTVRRVALNQAAGLVVEPNRIKNTRGTMRGFLPQ